VLPATAYIVRQFSPVLTIGGGAVLDPLARAADAARYRTPRRFLKR